MVACAVLARELCPKNPAVRRAAAEVNGDATALQSGAVLTDMGRDIVPRRERGERGRLVEEWGRRS